MGYQIHRRLSHKIEISRKSDSKVWHVYQNRPHQLYLWLCNRKAQGEITDITKYQRITDFKLREMGKLKALKLLISATIVLLGTTHRDISYLVFEAFGRLEYSQIFSGREFPKFRKIKWWEWEGILEQKPRNTRACARLNTCACASKIKQTFYFKIFYSNRFDWKILQFFRGLFCWSSISTFDSTEESLVRSSGFQLIPDLSIDCKSLTTSAPNMRSMSEYLPWISNSLLGDSGMASVLN